MMSSSQLRPLATLIVASTLLCLAALCDARIEPDDLEVSPDLTPPTDTSPQAPDDATALRTPYSIGTFWRVQRRDGVPAYILGVLHLGAPLELGLPQAAYTELERAQVLVLEVAPQRNAPAELQTLQRLPATKDLRSLLGARSFALADRLAKPLNVESETLNRLRPWAALSTLQYGSRANGELLEPYLIAVARRRNITVAGLESNMEQLRAMECISLGDQAAIMRESLEAHERFAAINNKAIDLYRAQDIAALMRYLETSVPLSPETHSAEAKLNECLIGARNRVMAERLDRMLGRKPVFVAIGALHLIGERGVLALLESKGYRVEAVAARSMAE